MNKTSQPSPTLPDVSALVSDPVQAFRDRGFVPPEIPIRHLPSCRADMAWQTMCPVPLWLDMRGRRIREVHPNVRLAWTREGHLALRADGFREAWPRHPIPPGDPNFWLQEHIELLFIPAGSDRADPVQILATPWGAWWDNQGVWKKKTGHSPIKAISRKDARGRRILELRISLALTRLPVPPFPGTLYALIAYVGPDPQGADYAVSSPVDLGFTHTDRFGRFLFLPPEEHSLYLARVRDNALEVYNPGRKRLRGRLRLELDSAVGFETRLIPVNLPPQQGQRADIVFPLSPHRFTNVTCWFETTAGHPILGQFSLRASLPRPKSPRFLPHPCLHFAQAELNRLRQKLSNPLARLLTELAPPQKMNLSDIPDSNGTVSFAFTPDDPNINWFRVAKETMIRDGEGQRHPAAYRLWTLQSESAHAAWREIVRSVTPTPAQLQTVCDELNRLLNRRDLYDDKAFRNTGLPAEGRHLLEKGLSRLTPEEVRKFNRILLQSAVECIGNYRMDLAFLPGRCYGEWLRTGRPHLARLATKAVRAAQKLTILDHQIHLHEGMAASGLARAYDAFHPFLSPDDRKAWRAFLLRFLDLHEETARMASWTVTTIANANAIGNSGCGLIALALLDEEPERCTRTLKWVREYLWNWLDHAHGPNGGNTEGAQYWAYAMDHFLLFAQAQERITGSDDGMLSHPAVRNAMNMVRNGLSNDGAMSGVNDTIPMPVGGSIGWFVAGRWGDQLGLWYGDHAVRWLAARHAAGKPIAYSPTLDRLLLWRPDVPECRRPPSFPRVSWLPETETVLLRSQSRYDAVWTAGLKGARPPFTHHNQADIGAFWLDLKGERMILDPGYYKPRAEDHSLPLIGGQGPQPAARWDGRILHSHDRDIIQYAACDSTNAYNGHARRVVRHLVLLGNVGAILLEDIDSDEDVRSLMQCGGPTVRIARQAIEVRGRQITLQMRIVRKRRVGIQLRPERSLHDTHWGYHFADCRWFPVEITYRPSPEDPLLVIFTEAGPGSPTFQIRRADQRLQVVFGNAPAVSFIRLSTGWALA